VTKFVKYHPGGMVITTWAGRDATDPFYAFHEVCTCHRWWALTTRFFSF